MSDCTISDTVQSARKQHHCDHCSQPIQIGEKYRRVRGVWEGTIGIFRAHVECEDAALQMWRDRDLCSDEGILLSADVGPEDHEWLLDEYPVVAARLGIIAS